MTPDTEILEYCTNGNWVRAVFSALPAWFRFAQCLRRYKDTRDAFPHLVNAGKYSTTLFVVLFKFLNGVFATASFATVSKKNLGNFSISLKKSLSHYFRGFFQRIFSNIFFILLISSILCPHFFRGFFFKNP